MKPLDQMMEFITGLRKDYWEDGMALESIVFSVDDFTDVMGVLYGSKWLHMDDNARTFVDGIELIFKQKLPTGRYLAVLGQLKGAK